MNDISLTGKEKRDLEKTVLHVLTASTPDNGARKILLYFYKLNKTMTKYGVMNPSNKYLSKHFGWTDDTLRAHLCMAKKTGFLTITGYGEARVFDFNQALLEEKTMLFLQQKAEMTSQLSE